MPLSMFLIISKHQASTDRIAGADEATHATIDTVACHIESFDISKYRNPIFCMIWQELLRSAMPLLIVLGTLSKFRCIEVPSVALDIISNVRCIELPVNCVEHRVDFSDISKSTILIIQCICI